MSNTLKSKKKAKKGDGKDGAEGKKLPPQPHHSVCKTILKHKGRGPRNWCASCNCRVEMTEVYYG